MALAPTPLTRSREYAPASTRPGRSRAFCRIWVTGKDVTEKFDPHLISVKILDKEMAADEATITLDDRYGSLRLPDNGEPIKIGLGWRAESISTVFEGTVNDLEHFGQKGQGRQMQIEARSLDFLKISKTPLKETFGTGKPGEQHSFGDVVDKWAKMAGFDTVNIDPELRSLMRSSWMMTNESFLQFGQRIGREIGGMFKAANQDGKMIASFTKSNSFKNAAGQDMPTVEARAGADGNLIGWRIKPMAARPQWKGSAAEWFDSKKAEWDRTIKDITGGEGGWFGTATSQWTNQATAGSEGEAKPQAESDAAGSVAERGKGWVMINGEPQALAGSKIQVRGIRHGVDGDYQIEEAEHNYVKKGGYTTRCDIKQPQLTGNLKQEWGVGELQRDQPGG